MKQQKSQIDQPQQNFKTIRIGIRQILLSKDVSQFDLLEITRTPHPKIYALLTQQTIYIFNHKLNLQDKQQTSESYLTQYCESKIDIRLEYKLPPILHYKLKYSYNFQCVFLILANGGIAVFNYQFYLLGIVQIQCFQSGNNIKHCLDYEYYEKQGFRQVRTVKTGFFAFLFPEYLQIHELQISTNHKLSKYKPSYKFTITSINQNILDNEIIHPDNLKLFTFPENQRIKSNRMDNQMILVCNCMKIIYLYVIDKESMKIGKLSLGRIAQVGALIKDIQINQSKKRILLGLSNGVIKAYSYKEQFLGKVLYQIKVGDTSIQKIFLSYEDRLLAYSRDSTISVINLHNLAIEHVFRVGKYSQFHYISEEKFIGLGDRSKSIYNNGNDEDNQFSKYLILNEFNIKYKKVFEYNSQIVNNCSGYHTEFLQLADNSLLANTYESPQKFTSIQTYSPPKSVSVKCTARNVFNRNASEFWVLTDKSQIYQYTLKDHSINVTQIKELHKFVDKSDIQHRYSITYLAFLTKTVCLAFDSQTTEKYYEPNLKSNKQLQPLCLGTSNGQLLIVSSFQPLHILFKMKSLSTPISYILEIQPYEDTDSTHSMIIYGSQKAKKCIIVQVNSHNIPIESFRLETNQSWFQTINSELFCIVKGGSFNLYYGKKTNQINCSDIYRQEHYSPGINSESMITIINYSQASKQFILAGFSLGQILIYELYRNLDKKCMIHLQLLYLVQNSKEASIQYLFLRYERIYFNLNKFLVYKLLKSEGQQVIPNYVDNIKINKQKSKDPFNLQKKSFQPKVVSFSTETKLKGELNLPKIKLPKSKERSSSLALITSKQKPQFYFHMPDTELYRALISRNIIH